MYLRRRRPLSLPGPMPAWLLLAVVLATPAIHAATFTVEARPDNTFSPANLQIAVGDSVTWVNAGGFHNVAASDGSFRCANGCDGMGGDGDPASNAWSFTLTFDQADTIDYVCEVHASLGMTGRIVVSGAASVPGTLRFANSSIQVDEGAGMAILRVQRVGGSDGMVGLSFQSMNGSAQSGSDYSAVSGQLSWVDGDAAEKQIQVPIVDDDENENDESLTVMLSAPSGGASLGSPSSVSVTIVDNDAAASPGTLRFETDMLSVMEGDGMASLEVQRIGGSDGAVTVDVATSDGSASSGADYEAVVETLFWDDGDAASQVVEVAIVDDAEVEGNETFHLALSSPTGGAGIGALGSATLTIVDDDQEPVGPCVADEETLCLNADGRFRVRVEWRDFEDETGSGQTVAIDRRDSGLFYFFNENNIEMLVKVLDACGLPGSERYWVFYAATTNVEFTLTVTDTETGAVRQYFNTLGETAPTVTDTAAFATCP